MGAYFVREGDYLVAAGYCADGLETKQAGPGQEVEAGAPPGFDGSAPPFGGARWHVALRAWVDARSDAERASAAVTAVYEARVREYPPLSDFADAVYWAARGEPSRMDAWLARVDDVKQRNPKVGSES